MKKKIDAPVSKSPGLSSAGLKYLAAAAMTTDHIGLLFAHGELYFLLRCIGRLAFPLYAFLIAQGAVYTHSRTRYAVRLFLCGVLSEPVFDRVFYGGWWQPAHQNVLCTLLLGLLSLYAADALIGALKCGSFSCHAAVHIGMAMIFGGAAQALGTDYGWYGVALVVLFYLLRAYPAAECMALAALSLVRGGMQSMAITAAVPILLYNGEKGHSGRWFYFYYPGHLAVLGLLAGLLL